MAELGAERVGELGLGDDDKDIEDDFEVWREKVFAQLCERFLVGDDARARALSSSSATADVPEFDFAISWDPAGDHEVVEPDEVDFSSKHFFKAARVSVVAVRELRQGGTGSTVHVSLISQGQVSPGTADNLSVCPVNEDEVAACGECVWIDHGDTRVTLVRGTAKNAAPFPTPCTMRQALARYCDLTGQGSLSPKLAAYARDPAERDRLLHLSSSGLNEFHD